MQGHYSIIDLDTLEVLPHGRYLVTHPPEHCEGEACCIHNPSRHPLADAPLNWRADADMMERVCEHGAGHPDPDHLAYETHQRLDYGEPAPEGIHACDGCCQ